jgi:hypothetical protein
VYIALLSAVYIRPSGITFLSGDVSVSASGTRMNWNIMFHDRYDFPRFRFSFSFYVKSNVEGSTYVIDMYEYYTILMFFRVCHIRNMPAHCLFSDSFTVKNNKWTNESLCSETMSLCYCDHINNDLTMIMVKRMPVKTGGNVFHQILIRGTTHFYINFWGFKTFVQLAEEQSYVIHNKLFC